MNKNKDLLVDLNSFEFEKTIDTVLESDFTDEVTLLEPVIVHIKLYKDKDSVLVTGTVSTSVEEACARCLKPVALEINGTIEATYVPEEMLAQGEAGTSEDLENLLKLEGELLDLSDRVIEAIIVEVPLKVVCGKDCAGLCPVCGIDLNENPGHNCEVVRESAQDEWHKAVSQLKNKLKS